MRARLFALLVAACAVVPVALLDAPLAEAQSAKQPGWLGIGMEASKGKAGVLVTHIVHGSPAEKAGLLLADRIVSLDGSAVAAPGEVSAPVAAKGAGKTISLDLVRAGKTVTVSIVLAARPTAEAIFQMEAIGQKVTIPSTLKLVSGTGPLAYPGLAGRVVIVDFFATWCGPCAMLGPYYQTLHAKYGPQGLTVLGVSDEDVPLLATWSAKNGVPYTIASDPDDTMFSQYGAPALPASMIVDKHGVVREVEVGFDLQQVKHTEQLVQALLKEP